jgi:hypothetical protein
VTSTETKLACIKQAFSFNVFLENFSITFSNSLPVVGRRLIGRKFWGNFDLYLVLAKLLFLLPSKDLGSVTTEGSD